MYPCAPWHRDIALSREEGLWLYPDGDRGLLTIYWGDISGRKTLYLVPWLLLFP